jgi:hypothetical protein
VQGRGVGRRAADDDRHVELVDEPLEVERLGAARDVLGRDGGAADDEQVDPGIHDGLPQLLGALGGERAGDRDPGIPDLAQPLGDEVGVDVGAVDLLHPRRRDRGVEGGDLGRAAARGPRSGSTALEVEHRQPTEAAEGDRVAGEVTESIGAAMTGMSKW